MPNVAAYNRKCYLAHSSGGDSVLARTERQVAVVGLCVTYHISVREQKELHVHRDFLLSPSCYRFPPLPFQHPRVKIRPYQTSRSESPDPQNVWEGHQPPLSGQNSGCCFQPIQVFLGNILKQSGPLLLSKHAFQGWQLINVGLMLL